MALRVDSEPSLQGDATPQTKPLPQSSDISPFTYRSQRYKWRTFLSIIAPLLILGFYAFICFQYLNRPAEDGIDSRRALDAR